MMDKSQKYLFVYDMREKIFPERWRVLGLGETAESSDFSDLSGAIPEKNLSKMTGRFEAEYAGPRYEILTAWGHSWSAVQESYRGTRGYVEGPAEIRGKGKLSPGKTKKLKPSRGESSRPWDGDRRSGARRQMVSWRTLLLSIYAVVSLGGLAALAQTVSQLPSEMPVFSVSDATEVQAEAERISTWVATELPFTTQWLAPMGLFSFKNDIRRVVDPSDWVLANVSFEDRVERLNRMIPEIREDFLNAVYLLGGIFFSALVFACIALVRTNLATAFALCFLPLFATPIATEPLIGVDNMALFYITLPLLLTAAPILVVEIAGAIGNSVVGPRSESWTRIWLGLVGILAGAAATTVGLVLSDAMNAGTMVVAVGPIIYGLFSVIWGLTGLLFRRG